MAYSPDFNNMFTFAQYGEFALRLVIACICGALVGLERSRRLKEAGIRTHLIVCIGAALIMIISKYGFVDLSSQGGFFGGTRGADPARLAAQVISGIGFLGAGVIFHNGNAVKGLTTAAGLWTTAGIGLALGAGMYYLGIFVTVLMIVVQALVYKFAYAVDIITTSHFSFTIKKNSEFAPKLKEFFDSRNASVIQSEVDYSEDGYATYSMTMRITKNITIDELNEFLEKNCEVKSVSCSTIV